MPENLRYRFLGPTPEREFCKLYYGQSLTLDEWAMLENDMGNGFWPVVNWAAGLRFPGGKNCKHTLVPEIGIPGIPESKSVSNFLREYMKIADVQTIVKTSRVENAEKYLIEGVFTTNDVDSDGERIIIMPDAWKNAIPAFLQAGGTVMVNHGQSEYGLKTVGTVREITYTPDTLEIDMNNDVINEKTSARCIIEITDEQLQADIDAGKYGGFSWTWQPRTVTLKTATNEVFCHDMQIIEITITGIPANQNTSFQKIKTGMQHLLDKLRKSGSVSTPGPDMMTVAKSEIDTILELVKSLQEKVAEYEDEIKRLKDEANRQEAILDAEKCANELIRAGRILPAQKGHVMGAILNSGMGKDAVVEAFRQMPIQKNPALFKPIVQKSSKPPEGKTVHLKYSGAEREILDLHQKVQKYARENKIDYKTAYRFITKK